MNYEHIPRPWFYALYTLLVISLAANLFLFLAAVDLLEIPLILGTLKPFILFPLFSKVKKLIKCNYSVKQGGQGYYIHTYLSSKVKRLKSKLKDFLTLGGPLGGYNPYV